VLAPAPAIAVTTGVANATTKINNVDAGWQSFITGGGLDGASTAGPWGMSRPFLRLDRSVVWSRRPPVPSFRNGTSWPRS
jgi:hypothetical protein